MKRFRRLITTLIASVLFYLTFSQTAYAYIDPGTGSYILQLIMAALVGGLFAVKLLWSEAKLFLKNLLSREEKHEEDQD